jgi:NAD-dependent DNA ligase
MTDDWGLHQKTVVFTGTLDAMTWDQAEKWR